MILLIKHLKYELLLAYGGEEKIVKIYEIKSWLLDTKLQ